MAELVFPSSPSVGDLFPDPAISGIAQWRWDGERWNLLQAARNRITVGTTPPSENNVGDLWWDSESGGLYIFYHDGATDQWVCVSGGGAGGSKVHVGTMPPGSPQDGALWWDSGDGGLSVWTGREWVCVGGGAGGGGGGEPFLPDTTGSGDVFVLQGQPTIQQPRIDQPRIMGVTDGSDAQPGEVGEIVGHVFPFVSGSTEDNSLTITSGSGPLAIGTVTLPPGDWDLSGQVDLGFTVEPHDALYGISVWFGTGFPVRLAHYQFDWQHSVSPQAWTVPISSRPLNINATTSWAVSASVDVSAAMTSVTVRAAATFFARRVR